MLTQTPNPVDFRTEGTIERTRINLFKLDKLLFGDPVEILFLRDVVIILSLSVCFAGCTGACGDGKGDFIRMLSQQVFEDGGLAGTGRCRKYDELSFHGFYKTLSSCSLIFSSSSFMRTTTCWMPAWLAFEPRVLISRPISWEMKPSFFPFASAPSSACRK